MMPALEETMIKDCVVGSGQLLDIHQSFKRNSNASWVISVVLG